jgi:hypothetical protein
MSWNGNGRVTYDGWNAGGNLGPASPASLGGNWHQVSTADLPKQDIPGITVNTSGETHTTVAQYGPGSPCDWTPAYHTGAGHPVTALSSFEHGRVTYAAWVGDRDHRRDFGYGIATNYGGRWHQVSMRDLPREYISGITVDPLDAAHLYAVYNEHSLRFLHGTGHVFETWNGGRDWDDISGNLPDIESDALVLLQHGRLALATDGGVFTAFERRGAHTCWSHFGAGLPRANVEDLTFGRDDYIYAATNGRGVWRYKL